MKKTLKRILVISQVLVAGALFATACTNNSSDQKPDSTSSKNTNQTTKNDSHYCNDNRNDKVNCGRNIFIP